MFIIYAHAFFALLAIPFGIVIFLTEKGTALHKVIGRFWVFLLIVASLSATFIQTITPGQYSLIHLLIPYTMGSLIYSIWSIQRFKETRIQKYKRSHKFSMIGVYVGALLIAGGFTLMPGRFFHTLLLG